MTDGLVAVSRLCAEPGNVGPARYRRTVATYREFRTPEPLRAVIECGWMSTSPSPRVQRVLPDGCMDLIWTGAELVVAGPDTAAFLAPGPGGTTVGLRFRPGALPGPLRVPASALRDRRVPLAELHPAAARTATTRIEHGTDPAAVLIEIARGLPGDPADGALHTVVALLARGAAAASTADALGWTSRTLHRRCLAAFGYGPSVLRRVLRFRRAAALLHAGVPPAETAARTGYADQPHLSRELRALAGLPPSALSG